MRSMRSPWSRASRALSTLRDLLTVYLEHRYEVTRRRTDFARRKAQDRLHLVEGLLVAILDIDDVIAIIRGSDDTAQARSRLMEVFELSEIQTNYILEMPLRRLTRFSRIELETERASWKPPLQSLRRSWRTPSSSAPWSVISLPKSPNSTAHRAARSCSRQAALRPRLQLLRWRSPTTPVGCCSHPLGCWLGPILHSRCQRWVREPTMTSSCPRSSAQHVAAVG